MRCNQRKKLGVLIKCIRQERFLRYVAYPIAPSYRRFLQISYRFPLNFPVDVSYRFSYRFPIDFLQILPTDFPTDFPIKFVAKGQARRQIYRESQSMGNLQGIYRKFVGERYRRTLQEIYRRTLQGICREFLGSYRESVG